MKKHQSELLLGLTVGVLAAAAGYLAAGVSKMQLKEVLDRFSLSVHHKDTEEEDIFENEYDIFEDE